jgi:two-component system, chemotaxis family, sensor kinase CheA
MNEEILQEFITESLESLDEIELRVVSLDPNVDNTETLHAVFRTMHSIKGTASFCELPVITKVAHAAENLLDALRHRTLTATSSRVDLLCAVVDFARSALETLAQGQGEEPYRSRAETLQVRLHESQSDEQLSPSPPRVQDTNLGPTPSPSPIAADAPSISLEPEPAEVNLELDALTMMPDLVDRFIVESEEQIAGVESVLLAMEQGGFNAPDIAEAFRHMHSFKGNCGIMGVADLEKVTHALESQLSDWTKLGKQPTPAQITLVLTTLDALRHAMAALMKDRGRLANKDELLSALKAVRENQPDKKANVAQAKPPATSSSPEQPVAPQPKETPALSEAQVSDTSPTERTSSSIRVDTKKLDDLMNLVGELIIAETTVTHNPDLEGHEFESFQKAALNLNRITRLLQDVTMQVRMVPIESTFRKMVRLVRDVSHKQGKRVELTMSGEETEVDKSVVESIGDPLVHLIRNAIDHGLEPTSDRVKLGKPPHGSVRIEARHQGGEVWISISDDGRGIDPDKILASAIKKGVADPSRSYSRHEILNLIFEPGFSTAEKLTDISGRGVGMDVVKRNLERVNGRIDISTEIGKGTTFTLRIPLTLAIIEGMLVRSQSSYFTIPLLAIRESVNAAEARLTVTGSGEAALNLRNQHYPIVHLDELTGTAPLHRATAARAGILMLVESDRTVACLRVDEVVGQRQTVIKPLPEYLESVLHLSGCSILPSGEISLILDADSIVRSALRRTAA